MKIRGYDHIDINVRDLQISGAFYEELFTYWGFTRQPDEPGWWGWYYEEKHFTSFWIKQTKNSFVKQKYNRNSPGVNHIAFRAENKKDIDKFYQEFLIPNKIKVLYGGPKEYPEYTKGYYAVFFEDPDGIKLELMWFP